MSVTPVIVTSEEELRKSAQNLINAAFDRPTNPAEECYAKNLNELFDTVSNSEFQKKLIDTGCNQAYIWGFDLISVSVSYDLNEEGGYLHISVVKVVPPQLDKPGFYRLDDATADIFARAFLAEKYEEIPTKSVVIPQIRDFIRKVYESTRNSR